MGNGAIQKTLDCTYCFSLASQQSSGIGIKQHYVTLDDFMNMMNAKPTCKLNCTRLKLFNHNKLFV